MDNQYDRYRLSANQNPIQGEATPSDEWYSCPVPKKELKAFYRRSDAAAWRHIGLWLILLAGSGVVAFQTWGAAWAWLAFGVYGFVYSKSNSLAHELSHGTVFKTRWLNEFFYHLCSFMTFQEGHYWRWSHTRHHSYTVIVGTDPEIQVPRPPSYWHMFLDLFFLRTGFLYIANAFRHAAGIMDESGRTFVPDNDYRAIVRGARVYVFLYLGVAAWCIAIQSVLPAMFVVLPRFYGSFPSQIFNLTQHAGLAEDVYDHRLNSRTVLMNPVFSFLYTNMNYHIEHHLYPMVPFYNLAALHERIREFCPLPYRGLIAVYSELLPAVRRQRKDPSYFVERPLPPSPDPTSGAVANVS